MPYQSLTPIGSGDFTFTVWLKLNDISKDQVVFYFFGGGQDRLGLMIKPTGQITVQLKSSKTVQNTNLSAGQWVHLGFEYNGSAKTGQCYINGIASGDLITNVESDLSEIDGNGTLGSAQSSNRFDGSIAELKFYNYKYFSSQPLNSLVDLNTNCPSNTIQWNIGSDTSKRVCIHNQCSERLPDLITYVKDTLTITPDTTGASWEDNIDLDFSISKTDCGSGNDEECFTDNCFQHAILQAEDSDYTITSLPGTVDFQFPSKAGFAFPDYHTSSHCTHLTDSSTCYFVLPFFFAGITTPDAFTRDKSLIDYQFTTVYSKVPGEDTLTATLIDQSFSTVSYSEADNVEADIEQDVQALSGATLAFDGSAPSEIAVGDELDLVFQAPDGHKERDFKSNTFAVELVFTSNGNEVTIPVTPTDTTYDFDGSTTPGDERSVKFTIQANYLGTYTIRAGATLESSLARRLLSEHQGLNSELTITVLSTKTNKLNLYFILIPISIICFVLQYFLMTKKTSNTEQQVTLQYEEMQINTQQ